MKPGDARDRLSDGAGLYLKLFVKGGSHGWRLDYSVAGQRNTISLGTSPQIGLSAARKKAEELRKLISDGTDPSLVRKQAREERIKQRTADQRSADGLPPLGSFEAVDQRLHRFGCIAVEPVQFMQRARRRAAAGLHRLVRLRRQFEQREMVRYARQVHADPFGDGDVGLARVDPALDEARDLEARQRAAHQVLGHLCVGNWRRVTNDHRNERDGCPPLRPVRSPTPPRADPHR